MPFHDEDPLATTIFRPALVGDLVFWTGSTARSVIEQAQKDFDDAHPEPMPKPQGRRKRCGTVGKAFYLLSLKHGPIGNESVWYRPEARGYTTDLSQAGRFAEDTARSFARPGETVPILCDLAEGLVHNSVDGDRLRNLMISEGIVG